MDLEGVDNGYSNAVVLGAEIGEGDRCVDGLDQLLGLDIKWHCKYLKYV